VRLADGRRFSADLVVDARGPDRFAVQGPSGRPAWSTRGSGNG
jgi:hypothetical protein